MTDLTQSDVTPKTQKESFFFMNDEVVIQTQVQVHKTFNLFIIRANSVLIIPVSLLAQKHKWAVGESQRHISAPGEWANRGKRCLEQKEPSQTGHVQLYPADATSIKWHYT